MTKGTQKNTESLERQITWLRRAAWFTVILGFGAAGWGLFKIGHVSPEQLSQLGSYLQGSVASLWSLAAFLFVYVAFLGQKQQLLLQHEELELTRADLKDQEK